MADLTFSSWHYYTNTSGNTMDKGGPGFGTFASTITETSGSIDTTMRPGETFTDNWAGGGTTYHGLYDHSGTTFVVMQDVNNGYYLFPHPTEGDLAASAFPDTFELTDVQATVADTVVMCFGKGTLIMTPSGEVTVETLKIGDEVLSATGKPVPVTWIGRQTVIPFFGPAERLMPVRISAGALGEALPHSDLTVTADHAMLIDGALCHAGALVNGTTVKRVPPEEMGQRFTVYHIETPGHDIILANGAQAETFIDNVARSTFGNYDEYLALYGEPVDRMEESPLPRAMSRRQVPVRIRNMLAERAAEVQAITEVA